MNEKSSADIPTANNYIPYSQEEVWRLTEKLSKHLGPEYVSKRSNGAAGMVSYIEGWKAFNLANLVFGFNGWSSELKSTSVDYVDIKKETNAISVGLSVVVRVTIRDGTYHEDIGYGSVENGRSKSGAFEKAKKQAITDGMKRCLRYFGNALGNCLYDKDYLKYIAKAKVKPKTFNEDELLRDTGVLGNNPLKKIENNAFVIQANNLPLSSSPPPPPPQKQLPQQRPPLQRQHGQSPQQYQNMKNLPIQKKPAAQNQHPQIRTPTAVPKVSPTAAAAAAAKNDFLTSSIFDDSMDDDNFDGFNDLDDYELALIDANGGESNHGSSANSRSVAHSNDNRINKDVKDSKASTLENNVSTPTEVPMNVTFFSAKAANDVQSNVNLSSDKLFKVNNQSGSSLKRTLDQSKSTPVKRIGIDRHPVYPRSNHSGHSGGIKKPGPLR
ncbi:recombinase [Saccharomycopsis crataegensis]|uniref:DNA repair and recombination protein RAD52 n=1 Tax=Saccharomycopsis crataegensis TaxID=43959 RepID=A0AAV5QID9_9ASCO|nr:recombinase [Saccharomycopsis crataegensis]